MDKCANISLKSKMKERNTILIFYYFIGNTLTSLRTLISRVRSKSFKEWLFNSICKICSFFSSFKMIINHKPDSVLRVKEKSLKKELKDADNINRLLIRANKSLVNHLAKENRRIKRMETIILNQRNQIEEYSYITSHTLRAPIARIQGLSHIFRNGSMAHDEHENLIKMLIDNTKDADEVLHQMIDVLETGENELNESFTSINLNDIAKYAESVLIKTLKANEFTVKIEEDSIELYLAKNYFFDILEEIISNSVKNRMQHGKLILSFNLIHQNDGTYLSIKDNGRGFDSEQFGEKVFQPFAKFHFDRLGKGLGLYLCKLKMEAMGGNITLRSKENEGTEVQLYFKKK